jgi:drug/metabolite transporter (DMT)-like permease
MPERSLAHSVHTALILMGWAGLITAGVSFPASAILAHFFGSGDKTPIDWLGPIGLFIGSLSAIAAILFARSRLGIPLPNGSPQTERWIVPLWIAGLILVALRCTLLSGMPALIAEVLYSTYPFLIALGLSPALVTACPDVPQTAVTQRARHGVHDRRLLDGRS